MTKEKILINLVIVGLIALTTWFIWQDFNHPQIQDPADEGKFSGSLNDDSIISVVNFQDRALEIIGRPIMVREQFPPEIEADLRRQINDAYSSIRVNYDILDPWISLGQLRKVIGDYEGARDAWEFGGLLRPQNSATFNNLGALYGLYLNNLPKAEANYLQSVENDPANIPSYIDLAELYWNTGEAAYQNKISAWLLRGLEENLGAQNRIPLLGRLAKYYADTGDNQKAIRYYEEILILDSSYEDLIRSEIERLK
jgi:tetratricopeptide (TPR) repeat protein